MQTALRRNGYISGCLFTVLIFWSLESQSQNVAENIMPVGRVCISGQECEGTREDDNDLVTPAGAEAASPPSNEEVMENALVQEEMFDAEGAYQQSCFACHASGAAGAPILGDMEAWDSRMEKGMDAVMNNVINGVNAMPAKGMCMDCSEADLRAIVDYMITQ